MTAADPVRTLAQKPPVLALTARLGELKEQADREVAQLTTTLKHIDETTELLNQHGIGSIVVDLGDVGNSAAHARRAHVKDKGTPVFSLPGGVAA